ncbi:PREDICTED: uncharacterized protein LOC109205958 [Nicotiana attenuata]|uniref:uncharacterized protein LOC109205958 n=1 Tax=Nicotiana attenuata TaxID=49451 RepID=UPI00090563B4|nr:PREDICTED: uncharacterized protein LOC109205958 [Nicotiana attenuata]
MGDNKIDHTHPLFVHPSDTPDSVLIPIQLKGSENYGLWRRSMKIALQAKMKLGFVDGKHTKATFPAALHEDWKTCNAIVLSWIMNNVSPDLLSGIVCASNARAVWEDLRERFDKVNRMRIYQLHREIAKISQGTDSVSTYFTKLKELWREFDAIVPPSNSVKDYVELLSQQRLLQFLGGLNDSYSQARRQILMKSTEPSLNQAYAMVIEDETQKGSTGHNSVGLNLLMEGNDITALWSAKGSQKPRKNFNVVCDFCKMKGHSKEKCYQLIGYPPDFKGRRKPVANSAHFGNSAQLGTHGQHQGMGNNSGNAHTSYGATQPLGPNTDGFNAGYTGSPGYFAGAEKDARMSMRMPMPFTAEQYDQILKMLQKDNLHESTVNAANAAGIIDSPMLANAVIVSHSTDSKANGDMWIVDTGATDHMVSNSEMISKPKENSKSIGGKVHLPNGDSLAISCVGSSELDQGIISNDLHTGKVKGTGRRNGDLYYWPHSDRDRIKASAALCVNNEEELWHRRLGHIPHKTRFPFPQSTSRASKVFNLIHGDVWGPYRTPTYDGNRFFLTLVDDYSRMVWIFLLKLKSDVSTVIKDFMTLVKTQFNSAIKACMCGSSKLLCVTPQQNGVVERKHRQILEVARAIRFQGRKSPFEMFYGRPPKLQYLKVLGSLCYATAIDRGDKFGARAEPAMHMGYSSTQKGYRLYSLTNKHFFVSRDVSFKEYIFPFQTTTSTCRRNTTEQLIDTDDAFFINSTSEVSETVPDSAAASSPSPEASSAPSHVIPPSADLVQPHIPDIPSVSPVPATVMTHPSMGSLHALPEEGLRKSTRTSKQPGWLNDFVHGMPQAGTSTALSSSYPMSAYMSYASLSSPYFKSLCSFTAVMEPTSYTDALRDPKWIATMDAELQALQDNHTWELVTLPPAKRAIGCKWVYKVKYNAKGEVERYKARLVAKGYTQ